MLGLLPLRVVVSDVEDWPVVERAAAREACESVLGWTIVGWIPVSEGEQVRFEEGDDPADVGHWSILESDAKNAPEIGYFADRQDALYVLNMRDSTLASLDALAEAEKVRQGLVATIESFRPLVRVARKLLQFENDARALTTEEAERRKAGLAPRMGSPEFTGLQRASEALFDELRALLRGYPDPDRYPDATMPRVCPGCHAVAEPCAPGCVDAAMARRREGEETP